MPLDDVTTSVTVRKSASSNSSKIGALRPGDKAELLGSVPNWHRVKLDNGATGFAPKRWTRVIAAAASQPSNSPSYTMDVVDVGTGLAILVRGPDFTLVYDGGSNDDLARGDNNRFLRYIRTVAPDLQTIDDLILSHPHRDHVELLSDLFAAYQVKEVWDSGRLYDICGYRASITAIHDEPGVKLPRRLAGLWHADFPFRSDHLLRQGYALPRKSS